MNSNPYKKSPTYETENFFIRMVRKEDAGDLLECYSDEEAVKLLNADNCTNNFYFNTVEEMDRCIDMWLREYEKQRYVRFAIVDRKVQKTIGTIEIFNKGTFEYLKSVGILRIDLCSIYEKKEIVKEILKMAGSNFFTDFGLENIMTKSIPIASERIAALENNGYFPVSRNIVLPYKDYYIRNIITVDKIAGNVGYCGLICTFCHETGCGGCKSNTNRCGRRLSAKGCYQYNCCTEKGLNGCWECDMAPCDKDMFSERHDIRNRTFVKYAKGEGLHQLCRYVLRNELNGVHYGWKKDYDDLGSEEAVLDVLHNGACRKHVTL